MAVTASVSLKTRRTAPGGRRLGSERDIPADARLSIEDASDESMAEVERRASALLRHRSKTVWETHAVLNQALLRLGAERTFRSQTHFVCAVHQAMKHVLADYGRKRTGLEVSIERIDEAQQPTERFAVDLIEILDAIETLAGENERLAEIAVHRFLNERTNRQVVDELGVSMRQVKLANRCLQSLLQDGAGRS